MFITRTISGAVLLVILAVFMIAGGNVLLGGSLLISLIGMYELYRISHIEKTLLAGMGYLAAIGYYLNLVLGFAPDKMMIMMGGMILIMFTYVFSYPKYEATQVMAVVFGIFYVGVMISYIYRLRVASGGLYYAFLIFVCAWGCDTCAYCVGMLTKKIVGNTHRMAPQLSPKKSIEGAVGGVTGAGLLTALYCFLLRDQMNINAQQILLFACISAICGLVSMVGDLCASAIKRNYEIKDYGKLIPGHGGILDRFDSVIITAPIMFYLIEYLIL